MSMARSSRMLHYINYRMKITLQDARMIVGTFLAFDRHLNMVLGDSEEYRRIKAKKGQGLVEDREEKRALGLIILRGDSVVSMTIEGPPPPEEDDKIQPGGPGKGVAVGRGLPVAPTAAAPVGLGGAVRGVGGPGGNIMAPPPMMGMPPRPVGMMPPPGMAMQGGLPPGMAPGVGMPPPVMGMPPPPPGAPPQPPF